MCQEADDNYIDALNNARDDDQYYDDEYYYDDLCYYEDFGYYCPECGYDGDMTDDGMCPICEGKK